MLVHRARALLKVFGRIFKMGQVGKRSSGLPPSDQAVERLEQPHGDVAADAPELASQAGVFALKDAELAAEVGEIARVGRDGLIFHGWSPNALYASEDITVCDILRMRLSSVIDWNSIPLYD